MLSQPMMPRRHTAVLSGAFGIFAGLLATAWALFGYNLPVSLKLDATTAQSLMLVQLVIAFMVIVGGGLMLIRYPRGGGALLILGSLATFIVGIFYTRALESAARAENLSKFHLESRLLSASLNISVDRVVSTLLLVPVFPIALFLLIGGLGGLAAYARQHH